MIGCMRTRVRKQPIIALYFEFEDELKFYNLGARLQNEEQVQAGMATFGPFNSFLASGDVCHLLITFANSFGPRSGQTEHWSRSDQNC